MGLLMHRGAGYRAKTFSMLAGVVLYLVAGMAIALAAGSASAAAGEVVGSPYAPKVYVFGNDPYGGPESFTRVSTLTIDKSGYYKLTGNGAYFGRVLVDAGVSADILMEDLTVNVTGVSGVDDACAFQIKSGATVTLRLAGTNSLKSAGDDFAAIEVPADASLIITSAKGDGSASGSLEVISEKKGAGIGGNVGQTAGTITINGGTVTATSKGEEGGAAIGGGSGGSGGNITISGGKVTAISTGYNGGAGIGGGTAINNGRGSGGNITISGGDVTATSTGRKGGSGVSDGQGGAGIGGGADNNGGNIKISGGNVTATSTVPKGGAGIGGGISFTKTYGSSGTIEISGGVVTATGFDGSRGIGHGFDYDRSDGRITLSGGTIFGLAGASIVPSTQVNGAIILAPAGVVGVSSNRANGILVDSDLSYNAGTKTITLGKDLTIPSSKTLVVPSGYTLNLNGNTLTNNGLLVNKGTIRGGTVSSGAVINFIGASATVSGAAVLSNGFYLAYGETLTIPYGQSVTIPSGVKAINDGTIIVNGGTLTVTGTLINRGLVWKKSGNVNGSGIVNAPDNGFNTGGTLTQSGNTWTVSGVAPLPDGFDIGQGQTLSIPAGATAVINGTLTNAGTIDNKGILDNKGEINNSGTIMDSGRFINEQGAVVNNRFTSVQTYLGENIPFALIHVTSAGTLDNYGTVNNYGTIWVEGTFNNWADGVVNNAKGALLRITGTGKFNNYGHLKNRGTIDVKDGGTLDNKDTGTIDNSGGTINVDDDSTFTNDGAYTGGTDSSGGNADPGATTSRRGL